MDLGNSDAPQSDSTGAPAAETRKGVSRRALMQGAAWTVPAVMLSTVAPAYAASTYCPGGALYNAQARGRFLSGALGTVNLDNLVAFRGAHAAAWDPNSAYPGYPGPATSPTYFDTQVTNVDLAALNLVTASVGLSLNTGAAVGVYKNYAYAERDGHEIGASGAVTDSGAINVTGGNANAPQLGTLSLRTILSNVLSPSSTVSNLVNNTAALDLTIGALAGRAEQTACTLAIARTYLISYLRLVANSAYINGLSTAITGLTTVDVNAAVTAALRTLLLPLLNVVPALLRVTTSLSIGVNTGALTGQIPADPSSSLSINLSAQTATLDIGSLVGGLNNRAPNTRLFIDAPLVNSQSAASLVTGWIDSLLSNVITVTGTVRIEVLGGLGIDTTLTVNGSLANLLNGTGVTGNVAGLQVSLGTLATSIGTTVLATLKSSAALATALANVQNLLGWIFSVLQSVILLVLNLQNAAPVPATPPPPYTLPADFANLPADTANGNVKGQYDVAALQVQVATGILLSASYPVVNLHVGRGSVGETFVRPTTS